MYSYALDDSLTQEGVSLDSLVQFSELHTGVHTLTISAANTAQTVPAEVFQTKFYVLSDKWKTIQKSDFSNNSYQTALDFFKEKAAFLYRYQWVDARYIVADPDWENAYIVDFNCVPNTEPWRIHRFALPYYEAASYYLNNVQRPRLRHERGQRRAAAARPHRHLQRHVLLALYLNASSTSATMRSARRRTSTAAWAPTTTLKENIALINDEVRNLPDLQRY